LASPLHEMMWRIGVKPDLPDPVMPSNASDSPILPAGACKSALERPAEPHCTQNLRDIWDLFYRRRGRSWGGVTREIPELPCGSRVLELGCGSGKTILGMIGRGWRIVAIDISPGAVGLTRSIIKEIAASAQRNDCKGARSKDLTGDVELLAADGRLLPFRDGVFDAVFAFHVLGHLVGHERSAMAGEIVRVTRRDGMVFFRGFSSDDLRAGGDEIEERTFIRGDGTITHYFTEDEVLQIFRQLSSTSVSTVRWSMRVGGLDLIRSEIRAAFRKE